MEIEYPNIKGIKWDHPQHPELITIKFYAEDSQDLDMGIENPRQYLREGTFDLSKVSAIRDYYDAKKDNQTPIENECVIDFQGTYVNVFKVKKNDAVKAWLFYKSTLKS